MSYSRVLKSTAAAILAFVIPLMAYNAGLTAYLIEQEEKHAELTIFYPIAFWIAIIAALLSSVGAFVWVFRTQSQGNPNRIN